MRIGFDARFLTHPQVGGFKTYVESLVEALVDRARDHHFVLYVDRPPGPSDRVPRAPNVTVRVVPSGPAMVGMVWREQVALARQVARDRLDLLHCPALTAPLRGACPTVLTLHDTLWMDLPVLRGGRRGAGRFIDAYLRSVPRLAARQAAAIITVSEFSKRELCSRLGLSEDLVVVTPEAASNALASSPSAAQVSGTLARLGLASGFVLALASNDPRKNFAGVMDAYSRLPEAVQEAHPLVGTVASASALKGVTRLVLAHGMTDKVRLFHGLSNEELHHVYCSASVFVFPSLGEGFGLPVLEAMASGTPVVTANATSLPEVAGDAALLCDPRSPEATAAHVLSVLSNPALRASLVEKGRQRAAAFSWRRCADATVACYERTLRRLHSVAPGFRSIGARP